MIKTTNPETQHIPYTNTWGNNPDCISNYNLPALFTNIAPNCTFRSIWTLLGNWQKMSCNKHNFNCFMVCFFRIFEPHPAQIGMEMSLRSMLWSQRSIASVSIGKSSTGSENFQKQTILFHSNKKEPNGNNIHSGTEGASTAAVKQRKKKSWSVLSLTMDPQPFEQGALASLLKEPAISMSRLHKKPVKIPSLPCPGGGLSPCAKSPRSSLCSKMVPASKRNACHHR